MTTKTLSLTGEISSDNLADTVSSIKEADRTKGPTTLYISSAGGDVIAGMAIWDILRSTINPIITIGLGEVGSMAALLLQAGDWRIMTKNTTMLLHDGQVTMQNKLLDSKVHLTEALRQHDIYITLMAERSKLTKKKVEELCSKETYLSAEEALKLGLVDEIRNPRPYKTFRKRR